MEKGVSCLLLLATSDRARSSAIKLMAQVDTQECSKSASRYHKSKHPTNDLTYHLCLLKTWSYCKCLGVNCIH